MSKKISELFEDFHNIYKATENFIITRQWYKNELGVISYNSEKSALNTNGDFSEEYIRARFVYSLIHSGKFNKEDLCIEGQFPKGNGGKSINPDIVVFKNSDWYEILSREKEITHGFVKLKDNLLMVFEAKKDSKSDIQTIIQKQLSTSMSEYQHNEDSLDKNEVYGCYFDDKSEIILFKKEQNFKLKRFFEEKNVEDGANNWNIDNRDVFTSIPTYNELKNNVEKYHDISTFTYEDLEIIDEEIFNENLIKINRIKDSITAINVSKYIVEFLTFKIIDEKKCSQDDKRTIKFYKQDKENIQDFRIRMYELQTEAESEFHNILNNRMFSYKKENNGTIQLRDGLDNKIEGFLIEVIKIFEIYSILKANNSSFNQIIFNNFSSMSDKAENKQFFTPVSIVNLIIDLLNPKQNEIIADPTSGICDFLAMSFKKIHGKNKTNVSDLARNLYGFDIDEEVIKLAELNLILNGDGGANLFKVKNSLTSKMTLNKKGIISDKDFTTDNYSIDNWDVISDKQPIFKQFDMIVTNPPFGKGRDLKCDYKKGGKNAQIPETTLKLYETYWFKNNSCYIDGNFRNINKLQEDLKLSKKELKDLGRKEITFPNSMDLGVLFLENAVKQLKEGGRMAIILSSSIASIQEWENIRQWFMSKMRVVGIIDLPSNIFAETGVSTTIIMAYKPKTKTILDSNYKIFTKEIKNTGYEVKVKDRIVNFIPQFKINEETFDVEKDNDGNPIINEDMTETIKGFNDWLVSQEKELKEVFNV